MSQKPKHSLNDAQTAFAAILKLSREALDAAASERPVDEQISRLAYAALTDAAAVLQEFEEQWRRT